MELSFVELNTSRGIIKVDFLSNIKDLVQPEKDLIALGLNINNHREKYNGIKIGVDTQIIDNFYKRRHSLRSYFGHMNKERQNNWERVSNFKYMILQPFIRVDNYDFRDFIYRLDLYSFINISNNRINCLCINLDSLTEEDKSLNNIVCDGHKININELCRELKILDKEQVIMESNIVDDCMIILDDNRFFMLNLKKMLAISPHFGEHLIGREVNGDIFKQLYYFRLLILTGKNIMNVRV